MSCYTNYYDDVVNKIESEFVPIDIVNDCNKLDIPEEIYNLLSDENDEEFMHCIDDYMQLNIKNFDLLKWTFITALEKHLMFDAMCGLAIKCEEPYPIASTCTDNHGRFSIDIIYNSYMDYLHDLDMWSCARMNSLTEQNKEKSIIVQKKYDAYEDINDDELLEICETFASYIRIKNKLSTHFG